MIIQANYQEAAYQIDLSKPIDLSIALSNTQQPKCFYAPDFKAEPLIAGDFIGSVAAGAPVNFFNIQLNPHGNGTHTECMGHISDQGFTINQELKQFHFFAELISVYPEKMGNGDQVITLAMLKEINILRQVEKKTTSISALIIRTFPNSPDKKTRNYSGSNPAYFELEAIEWLVDLKIEHLILDLPSIDREQDGGKLEGHKAWWLFPSLERLHCTVTEMVYVPDEVEDGLYFLNLQIAPFELDASPGKPVLYQVEKI